jgi:hypothetical protein
VAFDYASGAFCEAQAAAEAMRRIAARKAVEAADYAQFPSFVSLADDEPSTPTGRVGCCKLKPVPGCGVWFQRLSYTIGRFQVSLSISTRAPT